LFDLAFVIFQSLGANDAELTWLRNNKEIPENPDFRREKDGNTYRLVVTEVYVYRSDNTRNRIHRFLFCFRFPEDSGIFSALLKTPSEGSPRVSSCSVIIQGNFVSNESIQTNLSISFSSR